MQIYTLKIIFFMQGFKKTAAVQLGWPVEGKDTALIYVISPFMDTMDDFVIWLMRGQAPGYDVYIVTLLRQAGALLIEDPFRAAYNVVYGNIWYEENIQKPVLKNIISLLRCHIDR